MFGRRRKQAETDPLAGINPAGAPPRFAAPVADALEARRRYRELLDGLRPGAVKDRLTGMGAQVDAGVIAVWDTAQRAGELERVLATLGPDRVTDDYKQAKRADVDPEVMAAHEARFASVQRLLNALDDTEEQLRLLDVRLGGAVARAAEVVLAAGEGLDQLDAELGAVVDDLGSLRSGLDALG